MRTDRWWPEMRAIVQAVLETPGASRSELRRWAAANAAGDPSHAAPAGTPETLQQYVELVATHAYRTTDAHIQALRAHGLSDDEIFELTTAAAVGAARRRLECALAALDEANT
jgi:alkylhydroperoxidase family enzyme